MNTKDKESAIQIMQTFFRENDGNRLNQWNASSFFQVMNTKFDEIIKKDTQEMLDMQARTDSSPKEAAEVK